MKKKHTPTTLKTNDEIKNITRKNIIQSKIVLMIDMENDMEKDPLMDEEITPIADDEFLDCSVPETIFKSKFDLNENKQALYLYELDPQEFNMDEDSKEKLLTSFSSHFMSQDDDQILSSPSSSSTHEIYDSSTYQNGVTCEHCGKTLKNLSYLKAHMKNLHFQLLPVDTQFKCDSCGKKYTNKNNLITHFDTCKMSSTEIQNNTLNTYQQLSHIDDDYTNKDTTQFLCKFCKKEYKLKSSLSRHIRKVHS
ncbi:zinc finger protein OZF-like [Aphidius gifuensis]|uniref:zinc finger protein OZF-like n=1 Tax=Aphidius gifuensis TaxID=684658 RepID=UPI001CDD6AB5|nr:zinc finger protein OZF-like [Aphidius gifuensis]